MKIRKVFIFYFPTSNNEEVQEVFKMMGIEAFLSYSVAGREVKDEDLTEEKSDENKESEFYEDFDNLGRIKVENSSTKLDEKDVIGQENHNYIEEADTNNFFV